MQDHIQIPSGETPNLNHPGIAKIAAALKTHRKRLGLTQNQVAERLKISQSFLSKLENGKAEPSALQWLEFCEMTQIDPRCVVVPSVTAPPKSEGLRTEAPRAPMVANPRIA
jgi:DNA-binding XRE family transcriptional regulator